MWGVIRSKREYMINIKLIFGIICYWWGFLLEDCVIIDNISYY